MRERYLQIAGTKRLVIKNPLCLARADMLKIMFPDALFIFSLRAPWPTIQAAAIKGKSCYILPTEFVNSLPNDLVLRAAASWAESVDVLGREHDTSWFVARHEELVARPYQVISELYDHVGLAKSPVMHATLLPEMRIRDYSFIKYQFMRHPYRAEIISLLEHRARALGYEAKPSTLPGNALLYAAEEWLNHLRQSNKQKRQSNKQKLNAKRQQRRLDQAELYASY
jgi:Sulfotransferase family